MTKLVKTSLAAIVVGLLVLGGMVLYYQLDLGIQPCRGLPGDASNCADADMGGVYFVFVAAPCIFGGVVGLAWAAVRRLFGR